MDLKSNVEFWMWMQSDDTPYPGKYAIGGDVSFVYPINDIRALIAKKDLLIQGIVKNVNVAINFAYTVFEQCFEITDCLFKYDFGMYNNCEFNHRVIIERNIFNKRFDISDAHFNHPNIIPISISYNNFLSVSKFCDISSKREIIIEKCTFNDVADFSNCLFDKRVTIKKCIFKKGVVFQGTKFTNGLLFSDNDVDGCINLKNCVFDGKTQIFENKGDISKINFSSSVIKGHLELNSLTGNLNLASGSSIKLHNLYIEPEGYLIFRNINIDANLVGEIDFTGANLLGHVVLKNIYLQKFSLTNAVIIGDLNTEHLKFKDRSDSQTYVRLKNEALKNHNSIKAMEYRDKEMISYRKELRAQASWRKPYLTNRILLFFNTLSNKNGLSWSRGIAFTLLVAAVFFWLINFWGIDNHQSQFFILDGDIFNFKRNGEIWKQFLNMFYLTDFKDKFEGIQLNALGETIFLISKIFVSYGIYQTIAAFRKYSK